MHTYKYEIHVLAVYCRGKREKDYALWGLVCVNWRKKPRVVCCLFCKVLTLCQQKERSTVKLKCPLSVPKGKISGNLLPGMNLRIISLSTE